MEIDAQTIINALFGILGVVIGWIINRFSGSIDELRQEDRALADAFREQSNSVTDRLHRIEVLVSGQYMTRAEAEERMDKACKGIFEYLRRIDEKLDTKADK